MSLWHRDRDWQDALILWRGAAEDGPRSSLCGGDSAERRRRDSAEGTAETRRRLGGDSGASACPQALSTRRRLGGDSGASTCPWPSSFLCQVGKEYKLLFASFPETKRSSPCAGQGKPLSFSVPDLNRRLFMLCADKPVCIPSQQRTSSFSAIAPPRASSGSSPFLRQTRPQAPRGLDRHPAPPFEAAAHRQYPGYRVGRCACAAARGGAAARSGAADPIGGARRRKPVRGGAAAFAAKACRQGELPSCSLRQGEAPTLLLGALATLLVFELTLLVPELPSCSARRDCA